MLTGKYPKGVPAGSRGALEGMEFLVRDLTDAASNCAVAQLQAVAGDLGCSLGQMAIAWVARNPRVSSMITGASKRSQLKDNLAAVDVIAQLTPEVMARIDEITSTLAS